MCIILYIVVDCGQPDPADPNGKLTVDATTFGSTATYSCNYGYYIHVVRGGAETIMCLASGEWSDTAPACKRTSITNNNHHAHAQNQYQVIIIISFNFLKIYS